MKEKAKKRLIISSYWGAIGILIVFSQGIDMPLIERLLTFLCFSTSAIVITLSFSKSLFQQTVRNQKTLPLILKFLVMTFTMLFCMFLMGKMFIILESSGLINSTYYIDQNISLVETCKDTLAQLIAANLIICVILLYYEYSILKQSNLEAQLKVLHAQINPHFMFNVLNYLYVLMQKDTELASTLLLKYSDTLRYQLYSGKKNSVRLDEEIQFLNDFIDVEKYRWNDKLDVECQWNVEDGGRMIPPLLFIPLIENAFKHVSFSKEEKGQIHISLEQKKRVIFLKVINTLSDKRQKKKKEEEGIGLNNLKKRLDILYGNFYSLNLKEQENYFLSELTIIRYEQ